MTSAAVDLKSVTAAYGPTTALTEVDIDVGVGEFVTVLGANGAGKSSLFKVISGLLTPSSGTVHLFGQNTSGWAPHRIARSGVGQVPEGRQVFPELSVQQHLVLAGRFGGDRKNHKRNHATVIELFPILGERLEQPAGTLSGGQQQMLVIGRALMLSPRLLLLDEPSLGLAPLIVTHILAVIRQLADAGTSVLLIEQNAGQALKYADRGYVLKTGKVAESGTATELRSSAQLLSDYLGD